MGIKIILIDGTEVTGELINTTTDEIIIKDAYYMHEFSRKCLAPDSNTEVHLIKNQVKWYYIAEAKDL